MVRGRGGGMTWKAMWGRIGGGGRGGKGGEARWLVCWCFGGLGAVGLAGLWCKSRYPVRKRTILITLGDWRTLRYGRDGNVTF